MKSIAVLEPPREQLARVREVSDAMSGGAVTWVHVRSSDWRAVDPAATDQFNIHVCLRVMPDT